MDEARQLAVGSLKELDAISNGRTDVDSQPRGRLQALASERKPPKSVLKHLVSRYPGPLDVALVVEPRRSSKTESVVVDVLDALLVKR